jgi:beta-phosphoglucomutase family hydrolase
MTPERLGGGGEPVIETPPFAAVVFDMDGVLTDTARMHFTAWKRLFDDALPRLGPDAAATFEMDDYLRLVDGRARLDGVRAVLAANGIDLPPGDAGDPPGTASAWGLANRKDALFSEALGQGGGAAFPSSAGFVGAVRAAGLATAVVTASRHRRDVLAAAGLDGLFDAHVDGDDAAELGLAGKPAPDMFLAAAARLGVEPAEAVVVEDAVAGVEAGRRGGFGLVVGVDRTGSGPALRAAGADVVVGDLGELRVAGVREPLR